MLFEDIQVGDCFLSKFHQIWVVTSRKNHLIIYARRIDKDMEFALEAFHFDTLDEGSYFKRKASRIDQIFYAMDIGN